jgi:hypothetical protein
MSLKELFTGSSTELRTQLDGRSTLQSLTFKLLTGPRHHQSLSTYHQQRQQLLCQSSRQSMTVVHQSQDTNFGSMPAMISVRTSLRLSDTATKASSSQLHNPMVLSPAKLTDSRLLPLTALVTVISHKS